MNVTQDLFIPLYECFWPIITVVGFCELCKESVLLPVKNERLYKALLVCLVVSSSIFTVWVFSDGLNLKKVCITATCSSLCYEVIVKGIKKVMEKWLS